MTNKPSRSVPTIALPKMLIDVQPEVGPSLSAYMTSARPIPASRKPARSKRPRDASLFSYRKIRSNEQATNTIGTFTQKIPHQDNRDLGKDRPTPLTIR